MLFGAMMGLRIIVDLLFNLDEFTENADSIIEVLSLACVYYADHSLVYFAELGGVIIVASAAFSLVRMNHTNELTAMLASGVSLHRVLWPIIVCAMLMSGLILLDQELLIPRVAHRLIRDRDQMGRNAQKQFRIPAVADASNTIWYSPEFSTLDNTLKYPFTLVRNEEYLPLGCIQGYRASWQEDKHNDGWVLHNARIAKINRPGNSIWPRNPSTSMIWSNITPAELMRLFPQSSTRDRSIPSFHKVHDPLFGMEYKADGLVSNLRPGQPQSGRLTKPTFEFTTEDGTLLGTIHADSAEWVTNPDGSSPKGYWKLENGVAFRHSDLTPDEMVLRQASGWINFMSTQELTRLLRSNRIPDERAALLALHIRITNPINNLVMLLLGVPFILSRERNIKASIGLCILTVAVFYIFIYGCRFVSIPPFMAACLPMLIFGPIAAVRLDMVKT